MSNWFEGTNDIETGMEQVKRSFENAGEHYVGVVSRMPGLSRVELVDVGADYVTIRTNEGLMRRTSVSLHSEVDRIVAQFDEEYQAGSVTAWSHYVDEFTSTSAGVSHHTVISDVRARGIMGFFSRIFGSSSTGNAVLNAYKAYYED